MALLYPYILSGNSEEYFSLAETFSYLPVKNEFLLPLSFNLLITGTSASWAFEGQTITVLLTATGLAAGTSIPFTVTGIQQQDLTQGLVSDRFKIDSNGHASYVFEFIPDSIIEGETFKLTLNSPASGEFVELLIIDT